MTASTAAYKAGNQACDSLPYFDSTNEDYEEYAMALIEDEMKLVELPQPNGVTAIRFRSSIMQNECDLLIVGSEFKPRKDDTGKVKHHRPETEEASVSSVREAKFKYEGERIRSQLLEVEKNEAIESWKIFNESLSLHQMELSGAVKKQVDAIEEINYERQNLQQQQLGPQIDALSLEYQRTLYRINGMKHSISTLHGKDMSP